MASGAAFAGYFTTVDFIYDSFDPFVAAFAYTRLGVGIAAAGLLVLLLLVGNRSAGSKKRVRKNTVKRRRGVAIAFWSSKGIGTGALLLQNYAIV